MSAPLAEAIEQQLARARRCEAQAERDASLTARRSALQHWQAARLAETYADLRQDPRYRPAVEFFLTELYGAQDFGARERSFARAWRLLRRALPATLLRVLSGVAELQALTAELDLAVASRLPASPITPSGYLDAYRATGRAADRTRQIDLILQIGAELGRAVALPWVDWALKSAHVPAQALGITALQSFLEHGYAAFRRLGDPAAFLEIIAGRERRLLQAALRGPDAVALGLLRTAKVPLPLPLPLSLPPGPAS